MKTVKYKYDLYRLYGRWGEDCLVDVSIEYDRDKIRADGGINSKNCVIKDVVIPYSTLAYFNQYPIDIQQLKDDIRDAMEDEVMLEEALGELLDDDEYNYVFPQYA